MMTFTIDPHRAGFDKKALAEALALIERLSFSDPWSEASFLEAFENPTVTLTLFSEGEQPIAYALFSVIAPEAELLNLAVSPEKRKNGYGRALLERSFAHLRKRGVCDVFLEVREHNEAAKQLYLKQGFRAVGRRKAYYRYPTEDAIVMMAQLDK